MQAFLIYCVLISILYSASAEEDTCSGASCRNQPDRESTTLSKDWWKNAANIYEFSVQDIDGNLVSLEKYRGQAVLIVNVACYCGYTELNYDQLQMLYNDLGESRGLKILAFPCNQFGAQEPGTPEEIKKFVRDKGVTFDLFSKIEVNGDHAEPLWKFLKYKYAPSNPDWLIQWNFSKFLIDNRGMPVAYYAHYVEPQAIRNDILRYLV